MPAILWTAEAAKAAAAKSVATRQRKAAERALLRGEPASLPVKSVANGQQLAPTKNVQPTVDPRSERTRNLLAADIENQARILIAAPCVAVGELFTSDGTQGRAAVVKTLVEAASAVFGWSKDGGASGLSSLRRFDEAIDVTPCESTEAPAGEPTPCMDVALPSISDSHKPAIDNTLEK